MTLREVSNEKGNFQPSIAAKQKLTRGGRFRVEMVDHSAVCGGFGVRGFVKSLDFKENLAFFDGFFGGTLGAIFGLVDCDHNTTSLIFW